MSKMNSIPKSDLHIYACLSIIFVMSLRNLRNHCHHRHHNHHHLFLFIFQDYMII